MNFYFDANVSSRIARMLAAVHGDDHVIVHITEHPDFAQNNNQYGNNTQDIEIIQKLGSSQQKWIMISGDCDIIDTAHERAALHQSGLTFFALDRNWAKSKITEQAWKILKVWDDIERFAKEPDPRFYLLHMGKRQYVEVIQAGRRTKGLLRN